MPKHEKHNNADDRQIESGQPSPKERDTAAHGPEEVSPSSASRAPLTAKLIEAITIPQMSMDAMAQRFLDQLFAIDPSWKQRDEACAVEEGLSPAQRVLKYIALVLDQGLHLNALAGYDFVEPGAAANPDRPLIQGMKGICPVGDHPFDRKYPGQVCCREEHAREHFPPTVAKTPQYDDSFEKALAEQNAAEADRMAGMVNQPSGRGGAALPTSPSIR